MFESRNLSRDNLSREIGRQGKITGFLDPGFSIGRSPRRSVVAGVEKNEHLDPETVSFGK